MLELERILSGYPENERVFKRHILREYIQMKILCALFQHDLGSRLCFLGGTAIRIVHGNRRFSEDIDLDNLGISPKEFSILASYIGLELEREGLETEIQEVNRSAWHCYIKFPRILFSLGISQIKEEKILVQIDSEPQEYIYTPYNFLLNRLDVYAVLPVVPKALLLSQKIATVMQRKRKKGRDFYDISYLSSLTGYDPGYLVKHFGSGSEEFIKNELVKLCKKLDFQELSVDVQPFLMDAGSIRRVKDFVQVIDLIKPVS